MPVDQSKTFYVGGFPITYYQIEHWYDKYKNKTPKHLRKINDPYFSEDSCLFIAKQIINEAQEKLDNKIFDINDVQVQKTKQNVLVKSDYWDDFDMFDTDMVIKKSFEEMERKYKEEIERQKEELKYKQEMERLRQQQNANFWSKQQVPPPKPPEKEEEFDWRKVLNIPYNITITEDIIKKSYRKQAFYRHPDKGGSIQKMQELFKAKDIALKTIGIE